MEQPVITAECVKPLLETKFIKVFDLQYAPGKHYYDATRHAAPDLTALKSDEEFRKLNADAVTCFVITEITGEEPRLLLSYEYRYPVGRFLLSPTAGLIDPEDLNQPVPALSAARREIAEETGIILEESDTLSLVSPACFSTPGMTDESNALACAVVRRDTMPELNQDNICGSECFSGFERLTRAEAKEILLRGTDRFGNAFSTYTWMALIWFVSNLWQ